MDRLWSPWRLAYIEGPKDKSTCVFCRHAEEARANPDDPDSLVLTTGAHAYVVLNRYPYNNGHLMVVPYAHVDTIAALDGETLTEMMELVQRSQAVLAEAMRPQGFNLGMNQGRAAGAGIADHVHMHLLPRWIGDTNFMPALGDVRVMPQHLDETYQLLRPGFAE